MPRPKTIEIEKTAILAIYRCAFIANASGMGERYVSDEQVCQLMRPISPIRRISELLIDGLIKKGSNPRTAKQTRRAHQLTAEGDLIIGANWRHALATARTELQRLVKRAVSSRTEAEEVRIRHLRVMVSILETLEKAEAEFGEQPDDEADEPVEA
jgi:hypothetical protein